MKQEEETKVKVVTKYLKESTICRSGDAIKYFSPPSLLEKYSMTTFALVSSSLSVILWLLTLDWRGGSPGRMIWVSYLCPGCAAVPDLSALAVPAAASPPL
jgi:hypothetical protein